MVLPLALLDWRRVVLGVEVVLVVVLVGAAAEEVVFLLAGEKSPLLGRSRKVGIAATQARYVRRLRGCGNGRPADCE